MLHRVVREAGSPEVQIQHYFLHSRRHVLLRKQCLFTKSEAPKHLLVHCGIVIIQDGASLSAESGPSVTQISLLFYVQESQY